MAAKSDWNWEFTERAERQLAKLDSELRDRIIAKLDEIVTHEWRDPPAFVEPVRGSPYDKLRVGDYRLGCVVDPDSRTLTVASIRPRNGAYTGDD